ncbi:MAG: TspO/MBR family protein [Ilumatobacteraceae bacterium]
MTRGLVGGLGTIIVLIYAVGAGRWVSTDAGWYRSLERPPWQPPDVVFGLIWPYNFVMLGVASWFVAGREQRTDQVVWLVSLALSVVAALTWAYQFYVPHALTTAGFALTAATLLTLPLIVVAVRVSLLLGVALVPYQLWLAVATSLAFGYASRN